MRLPGGGGAPEIATSVREVFVLLRQSPRTFVEQLDFLTSVGDRVTFVVTDLCVLERDPEAGELMVTRIHPGVAEEQLRDATGWPLRIADGLRRTEPPSDEELTALRALSRRGGPV